jgi:hypothetical protein
MHLTDEQIAKYVDALCINEVNSLPAEMLQHVKECDICANEIMVVYDILSSEEIISSKKTASKSVNLLKWLPLAASIVLIAGLVSIILLNTWSQDPVVPISQQHQSRDSIDSDKDTNEIHKLEKSVKEVIPENESSAIVSLFQPHDELEKLYERFADGNLRGEEIVVHSKDIKITEQDALILNWENPAGGELIIEIYSNVNRLVFEKQTQANFVKINPKPGKGLYYWKLLNEDFDLLYCGKIHIE